MVIIPLSLRTLGLEATAIQGQFEEGKMQPTISREQFYLLLCEVTVLCSALSFFSDIQEWFFKIISMSKGPQTLTWAKMISQLMDLIGSSLGKCFLLQMWAAVIPIDSSTDKHISHIIQKNYHLKYGNRSRALILCEGNQGFPKSTVRGFWHGGGREERKKVWLIITGRETYMLCEKISFPFSYLLLLSIRNFSERWVRAEHCSRHNPDRNQGLGGGQGITAQGRRQVIKQIIKSSVIHAGILALKC